jgi:hypothetical protein
MREHMVKFIRDKYPEALPRFRIESPEGTADTLSGLFAGGGVREMRQPGRAGDESGGREPA